MPASTILPWSAHSELWALQVGMLLQGVGLGTTYAANPALIAHSVAASSWAGRFQVIVATLRVVKQHQQPSALNAYLDVWFHVDRFNLPSMCSTVCRD